MHYHYFQLNIYKRGCQNPRVIRFYVNKQELRSNGSRNKFRRRIEKQALACQNKKYPELKKKPSVSFVDTRWISGSKPDYPVLTRAATAQVGNILNMPALQGAHWVISSITINLTLGPFAALGDFFALKNLETNFKVLIKFWQNY